MSDFVTCRQLSVSVCLKRKLRIILIIYPKHYVLAKGVDVLSTLFAFLHERSKMILLLRCFTFFALVTYNIRAYHKKGLRLEAEAFWTFGSIV